MEPSFVHLLELMQSASCGLIAQDILLSQKLDKSRYPPEIQKIAIALFDLLSDKTISSKIVLTCYQFQPTPRDMEYECTDCGSRYPWGSSPVYMSRCSAMYCHGEIRVIESDHKIIISDLNKQLRICPNHLRSSAALSSTIHH